MPLHLTSMSAYLAERQELIAARESFLQAVRTFLRPEQRIDASQLGDATARAPFRSISDDEWVMNPARGYVTVMPAPHKGRKFKLSVLQLGHTLKVGIKVAEGTNLNAGIIRRLELLFTDTQVHVYPLVGSAHLAIEWQFDVPDIYTKVQAYEDAVYRIAAVFELALHLFTEPTN